MPVIYERTFPVGNKTGILAGAGILQGVAFDSSTNPVLKAGIIYGKGKHFVEGGIYLDLLHQNENINLFTPILGYRYQAPGGFFFRADFALIAPGISIGYSF